MEKIEKREQLESVLSVVKALHHLREVNIGTLFYAGESVNLIDFIDFERHECIGKYAGRIVPKPDTRVDGLVVSRSYFGDLADVYNFTRKEL